MATGVITEDLGDYKYIVTPDYAVADELEGISILKEELSVGQAVKIVQVGLENDERGAEFGFLPLDSVLPGVLSVTDEVKGGLIEQNLKQFACAYIANMAGKVVRFYNIGRVLDSGPGGVRLEMLTGDQAGDTLTLSTVDVDPTEFVTDEIALVDGRTFGSLVVVGWWEMLLGPVILSISLDVIGPLLPGGVTTIAAEVEEVRRITQTPTLNISIERNKLVTVLLGDFAEEYPSFGRWFRSDADGGRTALYLITGETQFDILMNENKSVVVPCESRFVLRVFSSVPGCPSISVDVSSEFITEVNSITGQLGIGACTPNSIKTIKPAFGAGWDYDATTWKYLSTGPVVDVETPSFDLMMDDGYTAFMSPMPLFITGLPGTITVSGGPPEINGTYTRRLLSGLYIYDKTYPGYFFLAGNQATILYFGMLPTPIHPEPPVEIVRARIHGGPNVFPRRGWPGFGFGWDGDLLLT